MEASSQGRTKSANTSVWIEEFVLAAQQNKYSCRNGEHIHNHGYR
jgi:hypothetical protein